MFEAFVALVRELYRSDDFIPLHAPVFAGNEKAYLNDVIDSTYVSSVGPYVERFEQAIAAYTGTQYAVATVNGTAALHIALQLVGVGQGDLVLTQAVSFVATANAIAYCGAQPLFVDVDRHSLGLSPTALAAYLEQYAQARDDGYYHRESGQRFAAVVPMHCFGHPVDLDGLRAVCTRFALPLIEDAAEALGSWYGDRHCGSVGRLGVLSFNGNKIMTTGGGGMILTDDAELARRAKHLTTTAKQAHPWQFVHDQLGYNYRMPNLNAALGLAQLEQLPAFVANKRQLAQHYQSRLPELGLEFVAERDGCRANYWLNALLLPDSQLRDQFLKHTNQNGVMTRPLWELLHRLPMYQQCLHDELIESQYLAERLVNIPSSVTPA